MAFFTSEHKEQIQYLGEVLGEGHTYAVNTDNEEAHTLAAKRELARQELEPLLENIISNSPDLKRRLGELSSQVDGSIEITVKLKIVREYMS